MSDITDRDYEEKVRIRAYHLWEQDGRPPGTEKEFWERACELIGMESNPQAGLLPNPVPTGADRPLQSPPVDEAKLEENLGEFPSSMTDQGERRPTPSRRKKK